MRTLGGVLILALFSPRPSLGAVGDACVNVEERLAGRAGGRSLDQVLRLARQGESCAFDADQVAAYELFRPGPRALVEDRNEGFRFDRPALSADPAFGDHDDCVQKNRVLACVDRYGEAMKSLETAVGYAAVTEPGVVAMGRKLAGRLLQLMRAKAAREVAPGDRAAVERAVDAKLLRAYGGCDLDQAGCLAGACSGAGAEACRGREVQRLKRAAREGNLRESMFFLYLANTVLTENVSRPTGPGESADQVSRENARNVAELDADLRRSGQPWQLGEVPLQYSGRYILQRQGYGADNNRMRDPRATKDGKPACADSPRPIRDHETPSFELIALSPRERSALAERMGVAPGEVENQRSPFHSGESCFVIKREIEDPKLASAYNGFLKNARDARIPMLTGISGTTDSILTLGRTLGLQKKEDFELLRAAALGWLVTSRDHSVHEIMTAASSFKPFDPYKFRPDGYKSILANHPGFARRVEAYQRAHGQPLPADVLAHCLITREASAR